jgi:small-conductance mechanosensitive channel
MPEQYSTIPLGWGLLVIIAYPLLTLIFSEWARRQTESGNTVFLHLLSLMQTLLLPTLAIWLVITKLAEFSPDSLPVKLVDTAIGIAILYALFILARSVVEIFTARKRTPRLLYDIASSILIAIGSAVIISRVWGFELTHLLSAVGVGSVVMGLALQGVIGGMVSGLLLLSARQFSIGDFLNAGSGKAGLVREIDWRSVTLEVSPTERLVLPSATLTSGSFSVTDTTQPAELSVKITIGYEHSPETVRAMLLKVAHSVPQLIAPDGVDCTIAEYGAEGIEYAVCIPVLHPGKFSVARNEFFSRVWYVAQRHAISIAPNLRVYAGSGNLPVYGHTAEDRAKLLTAANAFRRLPQQINELAKIGRLERWRGGETVLRPGEIAASVWILLNGSLRIFAQLCSERIELERLSAGQVFAIREGFRNMPSPVLAIAGEETELLSFPVPAMQQLLNSDPGFAADMETILETRAQALYKLNIESV